MDESVREQLVKAGRIDLIEAFSIIKAGYAGILPNGNIVDRRKYPDAIVIPENDLLGIPKPRAVYNPTNNSSSFVGFVNRAVYAHRKKYGDLPVIVLVSHEFYYHLQMEQKNAIQVPIKIMGATVMRSIDCESINTIIVCGNATDYKFSKICEKITKIEFKTKTKKDNGTN